MNKETGTGRKVWGRGTEPAAEPKPRRVARLERYLNSGKVLMNTVDAVEKDGREISTLGSIKRTAENQFVVGIDVYLSLVDVGRLREEEYTFSTLEEAEAFLARETGILFHQLHV